MAIETAVFGAETWTKGTRGVGISPSQTDLPRLMNMHVNPAGELVATSVVNWSIGIPQYSSSLTDPDEGITTAYLANVRDRKQRFFMVEPSPSLGYMIVTLFEAPNVILVISKTVSIPPADIDFATSPRPLVPINRNDFLGSGFWLSPQEGNGIFFVEPQYVLMQSAFGSYGVYPVYHGVRAFWWKPGDSQIYYSEPIEAGVPPSYANGGVINVGGDISGMVSAFSNIYIWTSNGRWFVLEGTGDPADSTLRFLGNFPTPRDHSTIVYHDQVFFPTSDENRMGILHPNGTLDFVSLSYLVPGTKIKWPVWDGGEVYTYHDVGRDSMGFGFRNIDDPSGGYHRYTYLCCTKGIWHERDFYGGTGAGNTAAVRPFHATHAGGDDRSMFSMGAGYSSLQGDLFSFRIREDMKELELWVAESHRSTLPSSGTWTYQQPGDPEQPCKPEATMPRIQVPNGRVRIRAVRVIGEGVGGAGDDYPNPAVRVVTSSGETQTVEPTGPKPSGLSWVRLPNPELEFSFAPMSWDVWADVHVEPQALRVARVEVDYEAVGENVTHA